MKPITLLIAASALAVAAAPATDEALRPLPSTWGARSLEQGAYLRATSSDGQAGRTINFMCNNSHELVAMALFEDSDANSIAAAVRGTSVLIAGSAGPASGRAVSIPFASGVHLITLLRIDGPTFRRMLAAPAAGIVWTGERSRRLAAFQLSMAEGREALAAFARACNGDLYP